jgi:ABC-type nitrate/sulfonate/bicarbonate transport system substrate-binding protein
MEEFLRKYPTSVVAYLRAIRRGFQLIVDDPKRAVELLSKGNYFKVDKRVQLYACEHQPKEVLLKPNIDGIMMCPNDMHELGYIKKPSTDIIVLEPLEEAEKPSKR